MMTEAEIEAELNQRLARLGREDKQRLLDFARTLDGRPRRRTSEAVARFFWCISHEDARLMKEAIEEGCGQIDWDSW